MCIHAYTDELVWTASVCILKRQSNILAKQKAAPIRSPYYMQLKLPRLMQLSRIIPAKILPNLQLFAAVVATSVSKFALARIRTNITRARKCMLGYAWRFEKPSSDKVQ